MDDRMGATRIPTNDVDLKIPVAESGPVEKNLPAITRTAESVIKAKPQFTVPTEQQGWRQRQRQRQRQRLWQRRPGKWQLVRKFEQRIGRDQGKRSKTATLNEEQPNSFKKDDSLDKCMSMLAEIDINDAKAQQQQQQQQLHQWVGRDFHQDSNNPDAKAWPTIYSSRAPAHPAWLMQQTDSERRVDSTDLAAAASSYMSPDQSYVVSLEQSDEVTEASKEQSDDVTEASKEQSDEVTEASKEQSDEVTEECMVQLEQLDEAIESSSFEPAVTRLTSHQPVQPGILGYGNNELLNSSGLVLPRELVQRGNSCTVMAVSFVYHLLRHTFLKDTQQEISDILLDGNRMYESKYGASQCLLSVAQALTLINNMPYQVQPNQDSVSYRIWPSIHCFKEFVELLVYFAEQSHSKCSGAVFIWAERSFALCCCKDDIFFFDSHKHGTGGALVACKPIADAALYIEGVFYTYYRLLFCPLVAEHGEATFLKLIE